MNVELQEIHQFLGRTAPFDSLPPQVLGTLPERCRLEYFRRGDTIITAGKGNQHLRIIRSGAVDVTESGNLVDRRGSGESFGYGSLYGPERDRYTMIAHEDTLVLAIDKATFHSLCEQSLEFHYFFAEHLVRIRQASSALTASPDNPQVFTAAVGKVIRRAQPGARSVVTCLSTDTVQHAAAIMAEHHVGAILVTDTNGQLCGIMTDKDLRNKIIATGRSLTTTCSNIMTHNPFTASVDTPVLEAMLQMITHKFNHLPILSGTELVGVLSASDIMRLQQANPIYVVGAIAKAQSVSELAHYATGLPRLIIQLANSQTDALAVSRVITAAADALTRRLIELAQQELGPAPCAFCWFVCGSQGRRELGPASDQDNGLILPDDRPAEADEYFAKLAQFVCDGLNAAGQVYCPGDVMATNPQWRQPQRVWLDYISQWLHRPQADALLNAQIFFDMRAIAGDESLIKPLRQTISDQAPVATRALAHLAKAAAARTTPMTFFRGFVLDAHGDSRKTLDLKHGGTAAAFELARLYALHAGLDEVGTLERLRGAAAAGSLSTEGASDLAEAFTYVRQLLLEHHVQQLREGEKPNNFIDPHDLSSLERQHLKDAFSIISKVQKSLSIRFPLQAV